MTLIRTTTSLSAVLLQEPSVIPVINRFGIRLGVSNATVGRICEIHSLDSNFVLGWKSYSKSKRYGSTKRK